MSRSPLTTMARAVSLNFILVNGPEGWLITDVPRARHDFIADVSRSVSRTERGFLRDGRSAVFLADRHCEEPSDEAIQGRQRKSGIFREPDAHFARAPLASPSPGVAPGEAFALP